AAPDKTAIAPAKSIAVLPFVHFGAAGDIDYFADGLTEELINSLAQLPDLKVAARTSSFYFKGRNEDLREIGRKLGVANVLEGSVRRGADSLRVTAQLIQVSDGFHLWSQTFDTGMDDVLAVQGQIARSVSETLKTRLLTDPQESGESTRDARAYHLELVARSHLRRDELRELETARALYRELLDIETDNASAYTGFAEATISLAQNHLALDFDQARRESEAAIETALRLAPDSAEAWRVRGLIHRVIGIRSGRHESSGLAEDALRRAVDLDPKNADALAMLGVQLLDDGRNEQATALLRRALEIDPLSRRTQQLLGTALADQGRFGEARRQYESLIDLYPDYTYAPIALAYMLIAQGKLDEAVAALDDPTLIAADPEAGLVLAHCYANLGMLRESTATLEAIREPPAAAAVAQGAQLLLAREWTALRELADREYATTQDPIWLTARLLEAVLTQDATKAAVALENLGPQITDTGTEVSHSAAIERILAAQGLRLNGRADEAQRIEEALLRQLDFAPGEYVSIDTLWLRALAYAALGQQDAAVSELTRATDQGFRTLIDFEYFVRLEDYPFMRDVVTDPRYLELATRIEGDNARMREALLAARP
ncbi:MAG TPA: tetratricopeptide repeat protein, partial [Woeseiaceae bacterium]|nr:tetratricopeptide repeat protein [Woeseiaceae bacterium]